MTSTLLVAHLQWTVTLDTRHVKRYTPATLTPKENSAMAADDAPHRVPVRDLVRYYLRLGLLGFGGPVALVGQMDKELVGDRKWLTKEEMREGIAVCQSLPGPLAIQVGIWISYLRGGFWGAWAGGWAFILPNFVLVAIMGALYVHFGGLSPVTAIFYGVSPAVIALILHSCYRLTKLGMTDGIEWGLAAAAFVVTVAVQAEVALLFIGCGIVGIVAYGSLFRTRASAPTVRSFLFGIPLAVTSAAPGGIATVLGQLLAFFLKAGALTFGSGLVIVPFLEKGLVQQMHWLNERDFLVAVAMGMISPGPVVITATFVGYLVAARLSGSLLDGFWGSLTSTIGIFLPSFLLVLVVAPILVRYRTNPNVQGFIKGAYAAAIGTILGACVLLGKIAIGDWLTALVAAGSLVVLFRWKVSNPVLVAVTAIIGLVAFPLLRPEWVFVK
jgi:chromate transporter